MANIYGGGAAAGASSMAQGIGGGLKALAAAPMVSQQAETNQALILAKLFASQQSGNKYGEEARGLKMTNDYRDGVDAEISNNPNMSPYEKATRIAFKNAGAQHMDNWSRSGQIEQRIANINAVQANPALATPTGQAYFSTSGSAPFDNVGNTGASMNRATGEQTVTNPTLTKVFEGKGGRSGNAAKVETPDKGRRTDIAEENQIRLQYGTEFPVSFGQRQKDAPNFQDYLKSAKDAKSNNKNSAPSSSSQTMKPSQPFTPSNEMLKVQADFKAGKITREQAKQNLKELGMPD